MNKLLVLLMLLFGIFIVAGCSGFDYSQITSIEITSEKSNFGTLPYNLEPFTIKTKKGKYEGRFVTQDVPDDLIAKRFYAKVDNIVLGKREKTIVIHSNGKDFKVPINKDNIDNGTLKLTAYFGGNIVEDLLSAWVPTSFKKFE